MSYPGKMVQIQDSVTCFFSHFLSHQRGSEETSPAVMCSLMIKIQSYTGLWCEGIEGRYAREPSVRVFGCRSKGKKGAAVSVVGCVAF